MRVDRRHPSHLGDEPIELAVVIDVLRATTTALVLLDRVPELAVVAQPESLAALPARDWLLVSELARAAQLGPRIDNSPSLAAQVPLQGRTPCLITTNGTRALCAAAGRARRVWVAGFVNLSATARAIAALAPARVTLVAAGDFASGETHAEDERCADALAARLDGAPLDEARLGAELRAIPRVQRRVAREIALAADVEVAFSIDRHPRVAEFQAAGPLAGWIRRCE